MLAALLASSSLPAQRLELTPHLALRLPVTGEVTVFVPVPTLSGFDLSPERLRETVGVAAGVSAEIRLRGPLALASGLDVELAGRTSDSNRLEGGCWDGCTSGTASVALGLAWRAQVASSPARLMAGAEFVQLFAEGNTEAQPAGGSSSVVLAQRGVMAAVASVGGTGRLRRGGEIKIDLRFRRYGLRFKYDSPPLGSRGPESSAVEDLRIGVGWRP